jgi:hypothetical protein
MAREHWSKIALICGALVLVWAAPARARVDTETGAYSALHLHGTHGYSIFVLARPHEGSQPANVTVQAVKGKSVATYQVPAKVTKSKIDADLGRVGRISVEFRPRGRFAVAHIDCNPQARVRFQAGAWVGRIEFKGEEDFTRVKATRARKVFTPFLRIACPFVSDRVELGSELPGARLAALSKRKSSWVGLSAITNHPGGGLELSASMEEQRGRLSIYRGVQGFYPGSGFEFDQALNTAKLSPAGPFFSGSGTFSRFAEPQNRWTGDLSVDLPGRSNTLLTGTRFDIGLEHARYTREKRYDERPNVR